MVWTKSWTLKRHLEGFPRINDPELKQAVLAKTKAGGKTNITGGQNSSHLANSLTYAGCFADVCSVQEQCNLAGMLPLLLGKSALADLAVGAKDVAQGIIPSFSATCYLTPIGQIHP